MDTPYPAAGGLDAGQVTGSSSILVVAGERSGDLHLAPVVSAIRKNSPSTHFWGAGGEMMATEGVELLSTTSRLAVMGFTGVPRVLPELARFKKLVLRRVAAERTPLAILTDYPGFNLNLARSLKRLPHPPKIIYYIAPQLWAWRPERAKIIRQYVDRLAVVFPFEVEFFLKYGIEAEFVGHPLLDEIEIASPAEREPLLAILPGSRTSVARRNWQVINQTLPELARQLPGVKISLGLVADHPSWLRDNPPPVGVEISLDSRALLRRATSAIVCSGTATLEAALLNTPQVVVYRTSPINYLIARRVIGIDSISLVNITAGRKVVPELIQHELNPASLVREVTALFEPSVRARMLVGYEQVQGKLGTPGAAERVAALALSMVN